jgi:hypothetical protein
MLINIGWQLSLVVTQSMTLDNVSKMWQLVNNFSPL